MVNIYIEDTGLVAQPFSAGETKFPTFETATIDDKRAGEFRVSNPVILKVVSMNLGINHNVQSTAGMYDLRNVTNRISTDPIKFSLTCFLSKPSSYADSTGLITKDLPDLKKLFLMTLSHGHKDLYLAHNINDTFPFDDPSYENLFSLYQIISTFGTQDIGNSNTRPHLNVIVDSISQNEGISDLSYNISFTVIWDFQ